MKTENSKNLYKIMQRFANVTIKCLQEGNLKRAEYFLRIADKLLTTGNFIIKNAVSNVFVYSLSHVLDRRDELSKKVFDILPLSIRKEYEMQVNSSGV